jgi:hypothetical protein
VIQPGVYRPRVPTVLAVQITTSNLADVAAWCHGRVATDSLGEPILYVGTSRIPARVGDYAVQDRLGDGTAAFYPHRAARFEHAYELACRCYAAAEEPGR